MLNPGILAIDNRRKTGANGRKIVRTLFENPLFLILILILCPLTGCGSTDERFMSIATGGTGGVYYPYGGGLAELINRHVEGTRAVAEVTSASVENAALVAAREADLGFVLADTAYQAFHGTGPFENRGLSQIRVLAAIYPNALQIIALEDSSIYHLQDLVGHRISVGAPGSGTEVTARTLLNTFSISYQQITPMRLNFNETADALRDGRIDAGIWSAAPPTGSILDLATSRALRLISFSPEQIEKALAADPVYSRYIIPAGTYPDQREDVLTVGTPNLLIVHESMDEELVYQIIQTLYDRIDYLISVHPAARHTVPEYTLEKAPIPLHRGARRYFENHGYEIPARLVE